jgi:hypothetical protein
MNWIHVCEWLGAFLGLLGAYMLATHSRCSKWGWVAFLASNVAMIGFALGAGAYGLLLMQLGFMGSSGLGCYRAGLWPQKRTA